MKRFAAAYTVTEHGHDKVKVYWTRAESIEIALENFHFFMAEQLKQPLVRWYQMHQMD